MEEKNIRKRNDKYESDICGKMLTRKWYIKLHKMNSCSGIIHAKKCSNANSVARLIKTQAT